jgi:branched-chain amino acid aminotransferase
MSFICHNGHFLPAEAPHLSVSTPAYKWGEGLFETMKVEEGRILLQDFHFERLFSSLPVLEMKLDVDAGELVDFVKELCIKNNCLQAARVRLSVYRQSEQTTGWVIETSALPPEHGIWNEQHWQVGIYPHAYKTRDAFSFLKTSNYLSYAMAGRYARSMNWEEALLLNNEGHICDGGKSNIFMLLHGQIITPSIDQGCIKGVMRRYIIENASKLSFPLIESHVTIEMLRSAEEVFLTNAIIGIQSVRLFEGKQYQHNETRKIYDRLLSTNSR